MVERRSLPRHLQQASVAVALSAAAAACYLLLSDDRSNWWDWLMGCGLGALTLYGIRDLLHRTNEEFVPTWRAGTFWNMILPFLFPLYRGWWSEDRGSRLAWLGWGLLAVAVVIQVSIWRLERSDPGLSRHGTGAPQH